MDQKEFSKIAAEYIQHRHAEFADKINDQDDGSFDCKISSPQGKVFIWIATYNSEITVGFETADGDSDWHTHMSLWDACGPEEELAAMSRLFDAIMSNLEPIVFSSKFGYSLTDDLNEELQSAQVGETVTVYRWCDL